MRLLLVEDDSVLQDGLQRSFSQSGYAVDVMNDGEQAESVLTYQRYDAIILDIGLPKLDGFELLQRLRHRGNQTPVIILTAYDDVKYRVKGLDSGADDYLSKPFDLSELEARVRALIRRGSSGGNAVIKFGSLHLDTESRQCTFNDEIIFLTSREVSLLELLMLRQNKVVSKAKIVEHLCNFNEEISDNALEANVSRLRKKVVGYDFEIRTIRGIGYLLKKQDKS
jgi:two-component system OmpR family response regulator